MQSIVGYLAAGNVQEAKRLATAALEEAREIEEAYWQHCEAEEKASQAWLLHGAELEGEEVPF